MAETMLLAWLNRNILLLLFAAAGELRLALVLSRRMVEMEVGRGYREADYDSVADRVAF